jgi:HlyD family secretion protein
MPAEAFIKTSDRSAMSYLMKPLRDQIAKAFIER